MTTFKVVNDKTKEVLLETAENPCHFAYEAIKQLGHEIFIEVYEDGKFSHWVDSDSIIEDCER